MERSCIGMAPRDPGAGRGGFAGNPVALNGCARVIHRDPPAAENARPEPFPHVAVALRPIGQILYDNAK